MSGETLSLWMRDPSASHAWMRIVVGGDPHKIADRRVFVEKTPRVYDPTSGIAPDEPYYGSTDHDGWEDRHGRRIAKPGWIDGPKGHADDEGGDGPDLDSRRWADEKARELGYVLPDMRVEIERLKLAWLKDLDVGGILALEDVVGFEEFRDELIAYRRFQTGL